MVPSTRWYGAVETGGTTCVCAIGQEPADVQKSVRIPTTTPAETLPQIIDFFHHVTPSISALGVGTFGPVDLSPSSSTFGHLLQTPKRTWSHIDLKGELQRALRVPIVLDTDVNVAARAEYHMGAAQSVDTFLYLTVGTGIGGCLMVNGQPLRGLLHPEMGHIHVPRASNDVFQGVCPYHTSCLEGLASASAIEARWGTAPSALPDDHPAWAMQAHYLAQACASFVYTVSPKRIILGGGVMQRRLLFPMIQDRFRDLFSAYLSLPQLTQNVHTYIVPPELGTQAGIRGALILAQDGSQNGALPGGNASSGMPSMHS